MKTKQWKFYMAILFSWTILIVSILAFEFFNIKEETDNIAKTEARANFNKDQAIRHWAALHGGVYIQIDSVTHPNPALAHIPERDIETPSGKKLTLMNPAYLIRELNEYFHEYYGVVGHITSTKLIRQENKPDEWELNALKQFEKGTTEISEYSNIDGKNYLRHMQPMITQQSCLKCHAHQGYKVGDIRGGVGISLPMKLILQRASQQKRRILLTFTLIWLIGAIGISFGYKKTNTSIRKQEKAEKKLKQQNKKLIDTKQELQIQNEELTTSEEKIRATNKQLVNTTNALKESNTKLILAKEISEKKENLLNITGEIAKIGGWEINLKAQQLSWTKEVFRIHELEADFIPTIENAVNFYDKKSKTIIQNAINNIITTGENFNLDLGIITAKGKYKDVKSLGKIKKDVDGNLTTIYGSFQDITIEKQLHKELISAKEKAEESDKLKTEFINNMSHEIRTPMNGILGFSRFLNKKNLSNEKRKYYINIIQSSGNQLMHIIDDILEISQLRTKQVKSIEQKICLNDLFLKLFSIFEIKAKENKTPLHLKTGLPDQESIIFSDETKLTKIISNLLENALKFTNDGFINFGYQQIDNKLEIYIKDTGIGINLNKQEAIFEQFSQEEKEISKKVGGLGLGLSIAKENAILLGGNITVESEKGKGATFFVTIPYKPEFSNQKEKNNANNNEKPLYNILIVEDEELNYLFIEALLEDEININCNIIHAKDGQEAVDFCRNNENIDFVLMDLKLPIMNGYKATKQIKEFRPNLPIIAQTAYSTKDDILKTKDAGCSDYISKPIDEDAFSEILSKYLIKV